MRFTFIILEMGFHSLWPDNIIFLNWISKCSTSLPWNKYSGILWTTLLPSVCTYRIILCSFLFHVVHIRFQIHNLPSFDSISEQQMARSPSYFLHNFFPTMIDHLSPNSHASHQYTVTYYRGHIMLTALDRISQYYAISNHTLNSKNDISWFQRYIPHPFS